MYTLIKLHEDAFILRSVNLIWQGNEAKTRAMLKMMQLNEDLIDSIIDEPNDKDWLRVIQCK